MSLDNENHQDEDEGTPIDVTKDPESMTARELLVAILLELRSQE